MKTCRSFGPTNLTRKAGELKKRKIKEKKRKREKKKKRKKEEKKIKKKKTSTKNILTDAGAFTMRTSWLLVEIGAEPHIPGYAALVCMT